MIFLDKNDGLSLYYDMKGSEMMRNLNLFFCANRRFFPQFISTTICCDSCYNHEQPPCFRPLTAKISFINIPA